MYFYHRSYIQDEKKIIDMPITAMRHLIGDWSFVTSEKIWFANNSLTRRVDVLIRSMLHRAA